MVLFDLFDRAPKDPLTLARILGKNDFLETFRNRNHELLTQGYFLLAIQPPVLDALLKHPFEQNPSSYWNYRSHEKTRDHSIARAEKYFKG